MKCPDCGDETRELIQGACASCSAKAITMASLPDVVAILTCPTCASVKHGAHWVRDHLEPDARLLEALRGALRLHPDVRDAHIEFDTHGRDERWVRAEVRVQGTFHDVPVAGAASTLVRVRSAACEQCSRKSGGYFEATLQVRASPGRPFAALGKLQKEIERKIAALDEADRHGAFVTRTRRVEGGLDLRIGGRDVARHLAKALADELAATTKESSSLVGRTKDGRDMYRSTILVRLPAYGKGDIVEAEGRVFEVLGLARRHVKLRDVHSWQVIVRNPSRLKGVRRVAGPEAHRRAVVVSQQGDKVQLLDPVTLKTVEVDAPEAIRLGEEAQVIRHEDRLWLTPPTPQANA